MRGSAHLGRINLVRAALVVAATLGGPSGLLAACRQSSAPSAALGSAPTGPARAGALLCALPVRDFGQVWQGAVLEHEFVLEVGAGKPGGVVLVKADCGCALTKLEFQESPGAARKEYELKTPLAPGAQLFVQVRYDTRDKQGPSPRAITIFGPDGALQLGLEADVRPWLSSDPERAQLGLHEQSARTSIEFQIASGNGAPYRLNYARRAVPDELSVELSPRSADAEGRSAHWVARVLLAPGMPLGMHTYPLQWTSDVPIEGSAEFEGQATLHSASSMLTVNVVGPVSITPAGLIFGVVKPDETVAQSLRLVCHEANFALAKPEVSFEPIRGDEEFALGKTAHVSVKAVEGEAAWDIQLLFSGLDAGVRDNFLGRLVIQTGHPGLPVLEALVRGVRMPMGAAKRP